MENQDKKGMTEKLLGINPVSLLNEMPVKKNPTYMRKGFLYWTGAMIMVAFVYQIVTGLMLLLYYNPAHPYTSTEYLINNIPYGALINATHLYGAFAMVVLVYVHLFRNYFVGAYKRPRQLQWLTGVILLALTIGVCFFGYSMPGDILGYDASQVGMGMAFNTPIIGTSIATILFGNAANTASLYSRLLGWHIILALLIGMLFGLHFFMAESNNIMPSGKESKHRAPAIVKEDSTMKAWYPYNMAFMIQLSLFVVGFIILIPSIVALIPNVPSLFSPFPGPWRHSPLAENAILYPDYPPWFLLFVYKAVDFFPGFISIIPGFPPIYGGLIATAVFGGIPLVYFLLVPFIDRSDDLHPLKRPIITALGIYFIIYLVILSVWGAMTPGVAVPLQYAVAVLLVPLVIVVLGMLLISKLYRDGKLDITYDRVMTSYFIFLVLLIVGVFALALNFASFMTYSSVGNMINSLAAGIATSFAAIGVARTSSMNNIEKIVPRKPTVYHISEQSATILSAILLVISVAIMFLVINLNPISGQMVFGVGIGVDFIIAGVIIRLYRQVAYNE